MKFEIVVLKSREDITRIKGTRRFKDNELTQEEMEKVIEIEEFLEKLTGFRYHINSV